METGRGIAKANKKPMVFPDKMQENEGEIQEERSKCVKKKCPQKTKKVEIKEKIEKDAKKNRELKCRGKRK